MSFRPLSNISMLALVASLGALFAGQGMAGIAAARQAARAHIPEPETRGRRRLKKDRGANHRARLKVARWPDGVSIPAPFKPAAPVIDGVRHIYNKGRLMPRAAVLGGGA